MINQYIYLVIFIILLAYLISKNKKINYKNQDHAKSRFKSPYIKELGFEKRNYDSINLGTSPYKKKENLLFKNEIIIFNAIQSYLENTDYYLCPKVRLADVIFVNSKYNFTLYFKKIGTKSIDILLCDRNSFAPKIAIYLDNFQHLDEDMIEDRKYITFALTESGVKVLRFNVNLSYDLEDISKILNIKELSS